MTQTSGDTPTQQVGDAAKDVVLPDSESIAHSVEVVPLIGSSAEPTDPLAGEPDAGDWDSCRRRLFALANEVGANASRVGKREQKELSKLLVLFPDVVASRSVPLVAVYETGIRAVLSEPSSRRLATGIRERVARKIAKRNVLQVVFSPETAVGATILGLGVLTYFALPILFFSLSATVGGATIGGLPRHAVMWSISLGAIGSVVSMMLKLDKFAGITRPNIPLMFWYAFFKPLIGAAFAFFVFAVIASNEFPFRFTLFDINGRLSTSGLYIIIAVSFVAGFSERFAKDIAMQVGNTSARADKAPVQE
jgi:hypothetical protein